MAFDNIAAGRQSHCSETADEIRAVFAELGIEPDGYLGTPPCTARAMPKQTLKFWTLKSLIAAVLHASARMSHAYLRDG